MVLQQVWSHLSLWRFIALLYTVSILSLFAETSYTSLVPSCDCRPLGIILASATSSKGLYVNVEASWTETPLLQEGLEWAARGGTTGGMGNIFSGDSFDLLEHLWQIATASGSAPTSVMEMNQEKQYQLLKTAVMLEKGKREKENADVKDRITQMDSVLGRFEMEMAARTYSPAVESHYAVAASAMASWFAVMKQENKDKATILNSVASLCAGGHPLLLMYAPGISDPQRVEFMTQVHETTNIFQQLITGETLLGKEAWRRELWLGEDAAGFSFLHLFPSSPRLSDATMALVLFGLPLDAETNHWIAEIKKWLSQLELRRSNGERVPSVRFLFGHMPLSTGRLCGTGRYKKKEKFETVDGDRAVSASPSQDEEVSVTPPTGSSSSLWDNPLFVQGYGVTVDLRNMEYKVVDKDADVIPLSPRESRRSYQDNAEDDESPVETEEQRRRRREYRDVEGFFFSTLTARYPNLAVELDTFASELEGEETGGGLQEYRVNYNVREMERMGYGALHYLYTIHSRRSTPNSTEQFETLTDVVFNFPLYAAKFSRLVAGNRVDMMSLHRELDEFKNVMKPGQTMAFFDGLPLTKHETSIHAILSLVKEVNLQRDRIEQLFKIRMISEVEQIAEKKNTPFSTLSEFMYPVETKAADVHRITMQVRQEVRKAVKQQVGGGGVTHGISSTSSNFGFMPSRIRLDPSVVIWLNDVERDPEYASLGSSLRGLRQLAHGSTNSNHIPRRNIFNVVSVMDPTTSNGLAGLAQILNLVRQAPPIRIGIVLVQETWEEEDVLGDNSNLTVAENRAADLLKSLYDIYKLDVKAQDLTDDSDSDSGGPNITSGDGAYALILETVLHLQQNRRRADIISFLEFLYTILDEADKQMKADQKRPEPKPLLLHRRQRKMISNLKAAANKFVHYQSKLEDDTGKTVMVNFYNHVRKVMEKFLFSSYPTVLLNGVKLNAETSFVLSLQAEARALYPLVESRVLLESMSSEEISEAIMKRFHAAHRNQRALEESITMPYWRGGTRTFTWVPSLLAFYEHRLFMIGGMGHVGAAFPTSVVSGVVLFPSEPTLRSLELFGKILDAADELKTVFRVTFLTFAQYARTEDAVIEGALESLLVYTYGEDWEIEEINEDDTINADSKKLKKKQSEGAIRRERCRFSAVQRFVTLVLSLASKMELNFDDTLLRNEELVSAVAVQLSSGVLETTDPILFEYWSGLKAEIESKSLLSVIRRQRQKHLREAFKEYIRYQAVPQGVLGRALGLEPPLKRVSTDDKVRPCSPLVLLLHGRAIRLDATFTQSDVEEAVHRVLPLSSILHRVLQQVSFDHFRFTREGSPLKYRSVLDKPAFLSARMALFAALLTQTEYRIPPLVSESDLFPVIQGNSRTMFRVSSPTPSTIRHHLILVVDPTKREAQTLLGVANYFLSSPIAVDISVYLNPGPNPQPIRSFYKFVAQPQLVFHEGTGQIVPPAAVFRRLPTRQLLTLSIEEPESWNVFSFRAEYDLDNIYLSSLPVGTSLMAVSYRLQSLVMHGFIFKPAREDEPREQKNSRPVSSARGLPLVLVPYESENAVGTHPYTARDTLVMSSSGYFQLPTRPGLWKLSIAQGKLEKNFYISEVEGRSTAKEEAWWPHSGTPLVRHGGKEGQRIPIMIDSFYLNTALFTYDRVWPHFGIMADMNRRDACQEPNWKPLKTMRAEKKPSLHIFSVASGHLYERFLRMMMHSVFRSSALSEEADVDKVDRLIKFWVIENFLSPQFKAMVPKMAAYYGFEVGFVSYHWPSWLPPQTEKQRKIWAYKILFLDVLFPLEVERVIFVDADQTALSDLHELYRLDFSKARRRRQENWEFDEPDEEKDVEILPEALSLETAPTIAMTPFCSGKNKNRATELYRFWEEHNSFWRQHLMGLPYHISAIFLVDVKRFRALGGGDMYRAAYSHLSQDPYSLSNLDQDLPNFLQHQVPIYSLPESWLWCETWCSADSRFDAKTIDLCNNPLTKVPKLTNAKTIIKHWESLDQELDELFVKLSNTSFAQMHKIEARLRGDLHESYSIPDGPADWRSEPLDMHDSSTVVETHDDL